MFDNNTDQFFIRSTVELFDALIESGYGKEDAITALHSFLYSAHSYERYVKSITDTNPDDDIDEEIIETFRNMHIGILVSYFYSSLLTTNYFLSHQTNGKWQTERSISQNITKFIEYETTDQEVLKQVLKQDIQFAKDTLKFIVELYHSCPSPLILNEPLITYLNKWGVIYKLNPLYQAVEMTPVHTIINDIVNEYFNVAVVYYGDKKQAINDLYSFLRNKPFFITQIFYQFYIDYKLQKNEAIPNQKLCIKALEQGRQNELIQAFEKDKIFASQILSATILNSDCRNDVSRANNGYKILKSNPDLPPSLKLALSFYTIKKEDDTKC